MIMYNVIYSMRLIIFPYIVTDCRLRLRTMLSTHKWGHLILPHSIRDYTLRMKITSGRLRKPRKFRSNKFLITEKSDFLLDPVSPTLKRGKNGSMGWFLRPRNCPCKHSDLSSILRTNLGMERENQFLKVVP